MGRAERNPSFRDFGLAMGLTSFYPSYGLDSSLSGKQRAMAWKSLSLVNSV